MHGDLAPLPELVDVARRHGAYLMLDEAHATGVVGARGRGTEEHYGIEGAVDILMGTFSKAPGTVGGYVTGSRELVGYLRFYARSSMFTAAPPAALCAGVTEAFAIMEEEPEHHARLLRNVRLLREGLQQIGMCVPAGADSAIIPVHIGDEARLWRFGAELLAAGIKAGVVAYPAVPRGEAVIRLTANARHTRQDIELTVAAFERVGRKLGLTDANHERGAA
jgi:7-keto-8-aminopelargonate synthetase-like enzyme